MFTSCAMCLLRYRCKSYEEIFDQETKSLAAMHEGETGEEVSVGMIRAVNNTSWRRSVNQSLACPNYIKSLGKSSSNNDYWNSVWGKFIELCMFQKDFIEIEINVELKKDNNDE